MPDVWLQTHIFPPARLGKLYKSSRWKTDLHGVGKGDMSFSIYGKAGDGVRAWESDEESDRTRDFPRKKRLRQHRHGDAMRYTDTTKAMLCIASRSLGVGCAPEYIEL